MNKAPPCCLLGILPACTENLFQMFAEGELSTANLCDIHLLILHRSPEDEACVCVRLCIWVTIANSVPHTPYTSSFLTTTVFFSGEFAQYMHIIFFSIYIKGCELHHILFKEYSVHIKIKILCKMMHKQVSMVSDTGWRCIFQFSFLFFFFLLDKMYLVHIWAGLGLGWFWSTDQSKEVWTWIKTLFVPDVITKWILMLFVCIGPCIYVQQPVGLWTRGSLSWLCTSGPSASYRPVTYISIPSLKVKMVVVLELLAPCFTSLMVS